jgi:hypothetical protein
MERASALIRARGFVEDLDVGEQCINHPAGLFLWF